MTQNEVQNILEYRNGRLYWKITSAKAKKGNRAGTWHSLGYWKIQYKGKPYFEHRLVWLYHHGWLPRQLDHINGDKRDNRIENLRPTTDSQNHANVGISKNSKTGYKGVRWIPARKKYAAFIYSGKLSVYIGIFETPEEAAKAYNEAAKEWFGDFARLNEVS
jgi:hypothetical protein